MSWGKRVKRKRKDGKWGRKIMWKKGKKREEGVSWEIEENLGREWMKVIKKLGENETRKEEENKGEGKKNCELEWMRGGCKEWIEKDNEE